MRTPHTLSTPSLPRRLGLWSSVGVVIGITIGSGIFRTPATIATRVPDPALMLAAWLLGGVITLCGALSFAELSAALPQTGGLYVYLREGWGRLVAFLFGWSELVLIRASAVGAIAIVFAEYLLRSAGIDPALPGAPTRYVAATGIIVAACLNARGVRVGAAVVGMSTIAKFGALTGLVLASFFAGAGSGASSAHFAAHGATVDAGLFGLALVSVLWAYDGFVDLSFAGGEVSNPQRTLPRAIIIGTIAIVTIYLATNAAYLYVSPIETVAQSPLIAADTMRVLVGPIGVSLVSVVVTISAFGALNGSLLAPPRVFFAMAADGLLFRPLANVHPTYKTPYVAILLAGALGIAFVTTRTFEQLADTFVLSIWPFYALGVGALYRLRASRPNLHRPHRVVGYPIIPAIFIAGVAYLVLNALFVDPVWTTVTFGIVLAGIPVHYLVFATKNTKR